MKKIRFTTTVLILLLIFMGRINAQPISGTKTIPGDYATISLAISALNTNGVGSGGVTFNVAAGYTESITAQLTITATGTSSAPIKFKKSGTGINPKIIRTDAGTKATSSVGGDGDGIIQISGTDYIVFDGIDVQATQSTIEYGYYTFKPSGTDGCQNDTIRNCTITLIKSTAYNVNIGIYISNGPTSVSSNTGVTVTNNTGRNENIIVCGDSIKNVNHGIYALGYNHTVFPFDYYDQNIKIGIAGAGNTIRNFSWSGTGGSTYGIYSAYSNNINASYNTINNTADSGTASLCWVYSVFASYTKATKITYSYNTISLTTTGTRLTYAFGNNAGDTISTLNIHHNTVQNCVHGSSGTFNAINNGVSGVTVNIYSNTISNNTINNGSMAMISPGSTDTANIYGNIITNSNINVGSGTHNTILISGGVVKVYDNVISNCSLTTGTSKTDVISISSGNVNLFDNTISGITCASTGESVVGIKVSGGTLCNIHRNKIYSLSGTVQSIYGIAISGGTTNYIYNNIVSDLRTSALSNFDAIRGISITSGTANSTIGVYYNTIYLNDTTSTGTDYGTSCIYHAGSATATTAALDMRNNIFINKSKHNGIGKTVAFRRSVSASLNNISMSNTNCFYVNTSDSNCVIYSDSVNNLKTLAQYKTYISPKDSLSISENTPFTNVVVPPYNLHVNASSLCVNAGQPITSPISITIDCDSITRHATTPDIGAYEIFLTGINTSVNNPVNYRLEQNYPNPFNPYTNISFSIPENDVVTLKVYDLLGREIETLFNNTQLSSGTYNVLFNGAKYSSGIYLYRLDAGNFSDVKKMILIK